MLTRQTFEAALKDAMRSGDETRKRTLRMILAGIKLAEVDKRGALDEAGFIAVLQKEVKVRREAIVDAERAGRKDLIDASQAELDLIQTYLPEPVSPNELHQMAEQAIREAGATSPQDMGKVMKILMPRLQGRIDGKLASDTVRSLLAPQ